MTDYSWTQNPDGSFTVRDEIRKQTAIVTEEERVENLRRFGTCGSKIANPGVLRAYLMRTETPND